MGITILASDNPSESKTGCFTVTKCSTFASRSVAATGSQWGFASLELAHGGLQLSSWLTRDHSSRDDHHICVVGFLGFKFCGNAFAPVMCTVRRLETGARNRTSSCSTFLLENDDHCILQEETPNVCHNKCRVGCRVLGK
jgi:hypothetical protein